MITTLIKEMDTVHSIFEIVPIEYRLCRIRDIEFLKREIVRKPLYFIIRDGGFLDWGFHKLQGDKEVGNNLFIDILRTIPR